MLKYTIARRVLLNRGGGLGAVCANKRIRNNFKLFATSSNTEYEIDYISLKKTPKISTKLIDFNTKTDPIDRSLIFKTINDINKHGNEDLSNFVVRYSNELTQFLKFIKKSYDNKVTRFGDLTSVELLNCLYIFKDLYLKNKIPEVNSYNYISYNYMFDNLLKFLHDTKDFSRQLNNYLLVKEQAYDLLSLGVGNYTKELVSLDKEFNFQNLDNIKGVLTAIESMVEDFNKFLINNNNLNFNREFFKLFIQTQKYKNLRGLLSNEILEDLNPKDLKNLLELEQYHEITKTLKSQQNAGSSILSRENLMLLRVIFDDIDSLQCVDILQRLYHLNNNSIADSLPLESSKQIYNTLINACCNGTLDYNSKLAIPKFTRFIISKDVIENYEFSMIFNHKIYEFVNELKILKSLDINYQQFLATDLTFANPVLQENFNNLRIRLNDFFKAVTWPCKSLDTLITYKNWVDWCKENEDTKIIRNTVDYSNLSNYKYNEITLNTELASLLPILNELSMSNNHINLSCLSTEYLLTLFQFEDVELDDLRQLNMDYGNVYLSNLQPLLDDYNQLSDHLVNFDLESVRNQVGKDFRYFTEEEISKHFGYYTDLISDPLILDNLLLIYNSSSTKEDVDVSVRDMIQFEEKLDEFKKELCILQCDELEKPFDMYSSIELLELLNLRINEVLSNLNPHPESRISNNIERYIELLKALKNYYSLGGSNELLEEICEAYILDLWSCSDIRELKKFKGTLNGELQDFNRSELIKKWNEYIAKRSEGKDLEIVKEYFKETTGLIEYDEIIDSNLDYEEERQERLDYKEERDLCLENGFEYPNSDSQCSATHRVPEELGLHEYVNELKYLCDEVLHFKCFTSYEHGALLLILNNEIDEASKRIESGHKSGLPDINSSNIHRYKELIKKLEVLFETIPNTSILDEFISFRNFQPIEEPESIRPYRQIPDDFKIEQFIDELVLVKKELGADFRIFKAETILVTLEYMLTEKYTTEQKIYLNKLLTNLRLLFSHNGNNTEVLDTVLNSHKVFEQFEQKKSQQKTISLEKLREKLVEFKPELTVLSNIIGDLECYSNDRLLKTIRENTDEAMVYMEEDEGTASLERFENLTSTLEQYFSNGGENVYLNALIDDTDKVYRQVPDHFQLEEYYTELQQLKTELGQPFGEFSSETILMKLRDMSSNEKKYNLTKRINLAKLYGNLVSLFKHNGGATFILESVLLNHEVFQEFEANKPRNDKNEFNQLLTEYNDYLSDFFCKTGLKSYDLVDYSELTIEEFNDICKEFLKSIKYGDNYHYVNYQDFIGVLQELAEKDHLNLPILGQLVKLNKSNIDNINLGVIKSEISDFMDEIARNRDLVDEEIKESIEVPFEKFNMSDFTGKPVDAESKPTTEESKEESNVKYNNPKAIKIDDIDDNELFATNHLFHSNSELLSESLREFTVNKKAYRPRETPVPRETPESIEIIETVAKEAKPIESEVNEPIETTKPEPIESKAKEYNNGNYLLLTTNGERILVNENPLSSVPGDTISILNKFSAPERNSLIKQINKLSRSNWQLIGGSPNEKFLVFVNDGRKGKGIWNKLKSMFAITGATFLLLMGMNWWLDDIEPVKVTVPPKVVEVIEKEETVVVEPEIKKSGWFWR